MITFAKKHGIYITLILMATLLGLYFYSLPVSTDEVASIGGSPYIFVLTAAVNLSIVFAWFLNVKREFVEKIDPKKFDFAVVAVLSVLVFVLCAFSIPNRSGMVVFPDEFGYFSAASYFAGYDLSGTTAATERYYSYGYSVLLSPLFFIFDNFEVIYKITLAMNSLFAACLVPLSYILCKKWGMKSFKENIVFAPIIMFSVLIASVIGWSTTGNNEVFLILITLMVSIIFYKIQEKSCKTIWFILLAFLAFYGYTVHQRFLGILVACIITVFVMLLFKKVKVKNVAMFFITLGVVFVVHSFIKNDLMTNLWLHTGGEAIGNDTESVFSKIVDIITKRKNFISFIQVFFGQAFYLAAGSFMMLWFALHKLIKENVDFIKNIKTSKNNFDFTLMFMLLMAVFSFVISVIFMHMPNRSDHLVFGRYNGMFFTVLCLYILTKIIIGEYKISKKTLFLVGGFLLATILTDDVFYTNYAKRRYNNPAAMNLTIFREIFDEMGFYWAFIITSIIGVLILVFQGAIKKKKIVSPLIIICTLSFAISSYVYVDDMVKNRDSLNVDINKTIKEIRKRENTTLPVCITFYDNLNDRMVFNTAAFDMDFRYIKSVDNVPEGEFYSIERWRKNKKKPDIPNVSNKTHEKILIESNESFDLYKHIPIN